MVELLKSIVISTARPGRTPQGEVLASRDVSTLELAISNRLIRLSSACRDAMFAAAEQESLAVLTTFS
jgi:hypothetical protein